MKLFKYTEKDLKKAVKTSYSIREVLLKLKVEPFGGNYNTFRKAVKYFKLDTSHFRGMAWSKGQTFSPKRPLEDYLSNKYPTQSDRLRKRLIKENILPHICTTCQLTEWLNKPIPLELHHIDGDRKNNNLTNLKLLCPNCHTLTDNYRGKKKRIDKKRVYKPRNKNTYIPVAHKHICEACKEAFTSKRKNQKYCSYKCSHKASHKIKHPTKEELFKLIWEKPCIQLAKDFGVSDKAIEKWCKKYNIPKPPRGYWAKQRADKSD